MPNLNEEHIRQLAEETIRQLGRQATPDVIQKVVSEAVSRLGAQPAPVTVHPVQQAAENVRQRKGDRVIITAFGKNHPGILAAITGELARHQCDILDLSQKILQDFFTLMLLIDLSTSSSDFETIKARITETGEAQDLKVMVQHEAIFNAMHRM
jgi:ACT domain-containing protein